METVFNRICLSLNNKSDETESENFNRGLDNK